MSRDLYTLPSFTDAPEEEHPQLLIKKLEACCAVYDFTSNSKDCEEKKMKTMTMKEVSACLLESACSSITSVEATYEACTRMFATNIFRPLPPTLLSSVSYVGAGNFYEQPDSADEEETREPAWLHLELVYEIFLRFLSLLDIKVLFLKKYIDKAFVLRLLSIFNTKDRRERACAKMILHKIYGKIIQLRAFIRGQMIVTFQSFAYEMEPFNGIGELLEIFGSIVDGYQKPLKPDQVDILRRVILPLHKPSCISTYHPQLAYCIVKFLEKDTSLFRYVVQEGILRYWPRTSCGKAVMLLNELEECMEMVTEADFEVVMVSVFKSLAAGYSNCHFQLAERSLIVTYNATIFNMASHYASHLMPIVLPALKAASHHWHIAIREHAETILDKWKEVDADLFERCILDLAHNKEIEKKRINDRRKMWSKIDKLAAMHLESMLKIHKKANSTGDDDPQDSEKTAGMLNGSDPAGPNNALF